MNQNHTSSTGNNGPRQKTDQVIYEAIAKACEIVVSSRGSSLNTATVATNSPSSSRFNLQVPEIQGVRSILQNYRLALHVPIRLDVYYQHDGGQRRELLERWCLEYQPAPTERFLQAEGIVTQDPIVQLRHVCKRLVLWLRTLYCWSRLLPAQAFSSSTLGANGSKPPIGFSIYVNSQNDDDISSLTQGQGFRWQNQPSPVVTPYGELGWKVFYSPSSCIKRLLPQRPRVTPSRPIPHQQEHQYRRQYDQQHQEQPPGVPQSAPAYIAPRNRVPPRSVSSRDHLEDAALQPFDETGCWGMTPQQEQQQQKPHLQQHTYHAPPRMLFHRSHSARDEQLPSHHAGTGLYPHHHQRRHTSNESSSNHTNDVDVSDLGNSRKDDGSDELPVRVMSGLSLALMMDEENGTKTSDGDEEHGDTFSERRHAALHEVPPHWAAAQHNNHSHSTVRHAPATAEYGYAYNSHIPWQRIHPSSNPPVVGRSSSDAMDNGNNNNSYNNSSSSFRYLGSSPSAALGSTPPSGAFSGSVGRTTPPTGGFLLRPGSVTPPFQPRPAGFVQEAPQQQLQHFPDTLLSPGASGTVSQKQQQQHSERSTSGKGVTSLDLLHSSPFQQQQKQQQAHGSLLSSLSTSAFIHASGGNDMKHSMWSTQLSGSSPGRQRGGGASDEYDDPLVSLAEDMPFAVDIPDSGGLSSAANSNSLDTAALRASSSLYSSSVIASFAQKCAPTQNRLKLFDKSLGASTMADLGSTTEATTVPTAPPSDDLMISNLADQLAEFRSFGASLQQSSQPSGGSESATSTGTPISLRS